MGVYEDLNNPNLFEDNGKGEYTYVDTPYGKMAYGQLTLDAQVERDAAAQRAAGGEDRRTAGNEYGVDDGGHLIGARFGGAPGEENLTPQDRNLNRSQYNRMESGWADHLRAGDRVYVNIESYDGNGSDRPTTYMGYAIIEHTDEYGNTTRDVEYISINNESRMTQEEWAAEEQSFYTEHPEALQEQLQDNTAMPYIWNEETGQAEPNPYYVEDGKSSYAPESTPSPQAQESSVYAPESTVSVGEDVSSEYAPESTVSAQEQTSSDYGPSVGAESSSDSSYGSSNDSGMDVD